jgi:hypothetical protein
MANGIAKPGRLHLRRMRLVHAHVADFVIIVTVRLLEHLHSKVHKNEGHGQKTEILQKSLSYPLPQ